MEKLGTSPGESQSSFISRVTWHITVFVWEAGAIATAWGDHKKLYSFRSFSSYTNDSSRADIKNKIAKTFLKVLFWLSTFCSPKILLQIQICFENILWKCCYDILPTEIQNFYFLQTSFKCHQMFPSRHQPALLSRKHSNPVLLAGKCTWKTIH